MQLHQLALDKRTPAIRQLGIESSLTVTCKIDGDQHVPTRFERSIPGAFRNQDDASVLPSWTPAMHEATDFAVVEDEEEGPVGYIGTWFLRGRRAYATEESRVFRADQCSQFWRADLPEL